MTSRTIPGAGDAVERIGLFGGSFNPVHLGHLLLAQSAREEVGMARLFFIPAARSPFKPELELAPALERLRLLRLALAGQADCEIDCQELERGGISYTIDTVKDYERRFPAAQFYYLIGADHLAQLAHWRDAAKLARRVQFVALARPGESLAEPPAPLRVRFLRGIPLGISSSLVRQRVKAGLPIQWLVGDAVAEAIRKNRLYV